MVHFSTKLFLAIAGAALLAVPASAEETHCKLLPKAGLVAQSYEIIGAEACKAACTETTGCTAWSYTPHNFNPKNGPGWCRMLDEVAEELADDRDFCGRL